MSDEELSGNVNTIVGIPKKSGGEQSIVKKTGTVAKNSTSKRLTRVKSSKKRAEDNEGEKLILRKTQRRMWGKRVLHLKNTEQ